MGYGGGDGGEVEAEDDAGYGTNITPTEVRTPTTTLNTTTDQ